MMIPLKPLLATATLFLAGWDVHALSGEIHDIAKKGDEAALQRMLEQNPRVLNDADEDGSTALHLAAKKGHLKLVELLLSHGAKLNSLDKNGDTPLHFAALAKKHALIEVLLKHGAEANVPDAEEFTPVFYSVIRNDLKGLQLLQQGGASLTGTAAVGGNLLHYAAMGGSPELLRYLVQQRVDVQARSINLETPLHWAMYRMNPQAIAPLLSGGAKVNETFDQWGNGILDAAILEKHILSAKALLEHGARINQSNPNGRTPLHLAVGPSNERISLPMVQFLLENGADVHAAQKDGTTVLAWAVRYCPPEIVQLLLEKGARVDGLPSDRAKVNHHVLHQALLGNNSTNVRMVLKVARQLEMRDEAGRTPLHLAVATGQGEAVKTLIARGANPRCQDDEGKSLLHHAAIGGFDDLAAYLLARGVPAQTQDKHRTTALAYAARYGHRKVVDLLTRRGVKQGTSKVVEAKEALAVNLAPQQAQVWYLGHSGWAVRTQNNLLIFDYRSASRTPVDASLANGHIVPEELRNLKVTVFVSFLMPDQWDPVIFEWPKALRNCTLVYGFNPAKLTPYSGPAHQFIDVNQRKIFNGIEVSTLLSNVGGVGFLVRVDGVTILHTGDHFNRQADMSGSFCGEIDLLAAMKPAVDIAFLPVHEDGLLKPEVIHKGAAYILDKLRPIAVFPMHAGGQENAYQDFIRDFAPKYPSVHFIGARSRGDHVLVIPRMKRAVVQPEQAASPAATGSSRTPRSRRRPPVSSGKAL